MPPEEPSAIVLRFYQAMSEGDEAVLDTLLAPELRSNGQVIGPEGAKAHLRAARAAFPDLHWTIEEMITDGQRVVTRYTYRGTHQGALPGLAPTPTGKVFTSPGIAIHRVTHGQISEEWEVRDTFSALQQLGIMPGAGSSPS